MLAKPLVQRFFNCVSWIVVLAKLCKSSRNISLSSESANITRSLRGDQFPNPECPLQPQDISGCGPIDIRRGCPNKSLPSNFCTRSQGSCVSETCCFCKCPSALPTFVSRSDGLKQCVSNLDLPNYIPHVRYPVCRYRVVAGHGLSPCNNGRDATIPVLDVTAPGNTTLTICSRAEMGIHRARAAMNVSSILHGISSCGIVPGEIKYFVDGSWHNLSRIHFDKFTISAWLHFPEFLSFSSRPRTYFLLKWKRALGAQFSGLIFSVKSKCTVVEQDRVFKTTHMCLLFKSAGTYRNVKPTVSQLPRSRLLQTHKVSRTQQTMSTVLTQPDSFNPTKQTIYQLAKINGTKTTEDKSMDKNKLGDSNSMVMIIVLSSGLTAICIVLTCGFVLLARRNGRNAKDRASRGIPPYDVPGQSPHTQMGAENTYEALQEFTRSSRGPHIYQSLNIINAADENDYLKPVDGHYVINGNSVKNVHKDKALPHLSSISDREISEYAEPDDDGYSATDFKEDGPVPVNTKRLPGYYEPACIILGKSPGAERPNSVAMPTYHNHTTPKYCVLEGPNEDQTQEVVNTE